jgi:hypothetical protein
VEPHFLEQMDGEVDRDKVSRSAVEIDIVSGGVHDASDEKSAAIQAPCC